MEGRHDGDAMEIDPVTAGADDTGFAAQEEAECDFAKTDDDGRACECDLLQKPDASAEMPFVHGGGAVAARTAFYDVCHVDMVAGDADGGERLVQQLPGGADQRAAVVILDTPGAFADDHERGIRRAGGEHGAKTAFAAKRAAAAGGDGFLQRFVRGKAGGTLHLLPTADDIFFRVFVSE